MTSAPQRISAEVHEETVSQPVLEVRQQEARGWAGVSLGRRGLYFLNSSVMTLPNLKNTDHILEGRSFISFECEMVK